LVDVVSTCYVIIFEGNLYLHAYAIYINVHLSLET